MTKICKDGGMQGAPGEGSSQAATAPALQGLLGFLSLLLWLFLMQNITSMGVRGAGEVWRAAAVGLLTTSLLQSSWRVEPFSGAAGELLDPPKAESAPKERLALHLPSFQTCHCSNSSSLNPARPRLVILDRLLDKVLWFVLNPRD